MNLYLFVLKTLVYFFKEGPHPTVPHVKMTDTLLAIYPVINFDFSLISKLKIVNFNKKSWIYFEILSYIQTDVHIVWFSVWNSTLDYHSLKVILGPNKIMNIQIYRVSKKRNVPKIRFRITKVKRNSDKKFFRHYNLTYDTSINRKFMLYFSLFSK